MQGPGAAEEVGVSEELARPESLEPGEGGGKRSGCGARRGPR